MAAPFWMAATLHLSNDFTAEDAEKLSPAERHEAPLAMKYRPRWPMLFTECRNVRLEGVRIVDSPCWTTRFSDCDGVLVRGITIDNNLRIPNNRRTALHQLPGCYRGRLPDFHR